MINFEKLPSVNDTTGVETNLAQISLCRSSPAEESLPLPLFEDDAEEDEEAVDDEEVVEEEDEDLLFLLASTVYAQLNNTTNRMARTTTLEIILPSPCRFILCKIDANQKMVVSLFDELQK